MLANAHARQQDDLAAREFQGIMVYLNIHSNCMAVGSFLPTAKYLPLPVWLQHRDG